MEKTIQEKIEEAKKLIKTHGYSIIPNSDIQRINISKSFDEYYLNMNNDEFMKVVYRSMFQSLAIELMHRNACRITQVRSDPLYNIGIKMELTYIKVSDND